MIPHLTSSQQRRLAGTAKYLADPRRNQAVPIKLVIAAWRRGWTLDQIAFACGVSPQRAQQRVSDYEKQHGPVSRVERPVAARSGKFLWHCAYCNASEWSARVRLKHGETHFCSLQCFADFRRIMTDQEIEQAIYLRWEGNSWKHITKLLGYIQQTVQTNIWKYLYVTGQLNLDIVSSIWIADTSGQRRHASWKWLELNTGIYCTEHGVEHGFRRGKKTPWDRCKSGRSKQTDNQSKAAA